MDKRSYSWGKLKQNMRLVPITYRHKVSHLTSLKATERIFLDKKKQSNQAPRHPLALNEGSENTVAVDGYKYSKKCKDNFTG